MDRNKLDILKKAVNKFYLDENPDEAAINDQEYDSLAKEYESEELGNSVKDLIDWPEGLVSKINEPEVPLDKTIVDDNNFDEFIKDWTSESNMNVGRNYYLNYKYDGCGIKAYYKNGRLQKIQSTPDEEYGIIRTKAFMQLFPQELKDKSIKCLRGEVLVDASVYGELSRNKANGLTNSQFMDDQVRNECFIRIYKIQYWDSSSFDYNRMDKSLTELPALVRSRHRVTLIVDGREYVDTRNDLVFSRAEHLSKSPTETIIKESGYHNWDDVNFQVDGVVLYSPKYVHAFKFYYTDSKIVEVTDIEYNQLNNGSYSAVINFDPVEINGKTIQRCSSGGISNMMDMKMGIGSKVKVILANLTIPKIIKTIVPSEVYDFPKCKCGYQMNEKDIFGSVLKCGNTDVCNDKVDKWGPELVDWLINEPKFKDYNSIKDCIIEDPIWFMSVLHIDRWDPYKKINGDIDSSALYLNLVEAIEDDDFNKFKNCTTDEFSYSDLQYRNYEINVASAFEVLKDVYYIPKDKLKEYNIN